MKQLLVIIALSTSIVGGCATTSRTKYGPADQSGGYSEQQVDGNLSVARFAGNAYTHPEDAKIYSQFRALEVCKERGYSLMFLYTTIDRSSSQTVQRSYTAPTYFSGNANSTTNANVYGNWGQANTNTNLNGQTYGGGTTTWDETYHYPTFDSVFSCSNKFYRTNVKLRDISAEDMKPFVKDLMGAVQVVEVPENSPNHEILKPGDFIIKVNGSRVQTQPQYVGEINSSKSKEIVAMTVVRDGKQKTIKANAYDGTDEVKALGEKLAAAVCGNPELKERPACTDLQRAPASAR